MTDTPEESPKPIPSPASHLPIEPNEMSEKPVSAIVLLSIWTNPIATFTLLLRARADSWVRIPAVAIIVFLWAFTTKFNQISHLMDYDIVKIYSGICYNFTGVVEDFYFHLVESLVLVYFVMVLLYVSGKIILKSNIQFRDYRIVVGWSFIPITFILLVLLLRFAAYQILPVLSDLFSFNVSSVFYRILQYSEIILICWTVVLLCFGVYVIHSYDKVKTTKNIITSIVIATGIFFLFYHYFINFFFEFIL